MTPAPLSPDDGRLRRSQRSRDAIVDATLDLVFEGRVPTSADIAARAGVTQRTLFNQFGDMRTLVEEVGRRQSERFVAMAPQVDTRAPLEPRIACYAAAMTTILEEAMHIRWVVLTSRYPTAVEMVQRARRWNRRMLGDAFAPELAAVVEPRRPEVIDELEIAVDPITWRMRRLIQGHSVDEARDRMVDTMRAILRDALPA